ncbi:MAG: cytochrome P450 [Myxococcaceae bacterium]|nr:cytochrome P450 [Myxococcaceae bacterium]
MRDPMSLPSGPKQPALFQLAQYIWRPVAFLEECGRRHGDIFTLRMTGFGSLVLVSSPELIRQVFTADPEVLLAGKANELVRPLLGDNSVLLLDGTEHLRQRRLLLPPFHGERMQAYAELIHALTSEELERWPIGHAFALHRPMQTITLQVILRAVFGVDEEERRQTLADAIERILAFNNPAAAYAPKAFQRDFPLSPYRTYMRLRADVDRHIFAIIAERRSGPREGRTDVLSLLLSAKDEQGQGMTDQELRDELVTLLTAGHETTATTLAWAFDRILADAQVQQRLDAELDSVVGGGPLKPTHLPRLEYLDAVIKETLRLRPIVPLVARITAQEFELGGHRLPAGVFVAPCIFLAHRRPDLYPEPDLFRPERFLGTRPDPYAWLPFGGGTRRCIGMAFALYEMKVILATVLSRVRIKGTVQGGQRIVRRMITLAPEHGTPVVVTERRRNSPQAPPVFPRPGMSA